MSSNVRGRKTKSEILDAAWDLISDQGADVSISNIASAVGVSRQTIYLHFSSRGGLLTALVRRADERFEIKELFDTALAAPTPEAKLIGTLNAWLEFVPKIYPVAKDLIRLRETDPEANTAWEDRMSDLKTWLEALMQSLKDADALKPHWSVHEASQFFWAQTSVQTWGLLHVECGWSEEKIAEKMRNTLIDSLLV